MNTEILDIKNNKKSPSVGMKQEWVFKKNKEGSIDLINPVFNISITQILPAIAFCDGEVFSARVQECHDDDRVVICYELSADEQVEIELTFKNKDHWAVLECQVRNLSGKAVKLGKVMPICNGTIKSIPFFRRFLINGNAMCDFSTLSAELGGHCSSSAAAFTDAHGDVAAAMGFTSIGEAFYTLEYEAQLQQIIGFNAVCDREGIALEPGRKLQLSDFIIAAGPSMSALMDEYAKIVTSVMGHRKGNSPTGWCSWYYYYDTVTEQDIWANIEAIKQSRYRDYIKVIQIDDGWNLPFRDHARVWGDWQSGGLFPQGMKHLADGIKKHGFMPGLWVAPFSVDPSSAISKKHPEWLVWDKDSPIIQEGTYALDLTNPEALEFVRETFLRIFNEWGFDYVKIDFLYHAAVKGLRFDASQTTAQAVRNGLNVIRDVAADRYVLGCGTPLNPAVGLCDGMRVGYDVSSHWNFPINTDVWPQGNFNIRAAAINSVWRQWMHANWWQNDPDCLILRDFGSEVEIQIFQKHFKKIAEIIPYGLSDDEAQCWAQLIWFMGGAVIVSENLSMLPQKRIDLLRYSYPPHKYPARWVDWYDNPEVAVLMSRSEEKMIGVFNLSDEPVKVRIPIQKLGVDHQWSFIERLNGETFSGSGDRVDFPAMGPHCGKIWIQK